MFCVYILLFLSQICISWQNETPDLSRSDISFLDYDVKIPWLALLALSKQEILFTQIADPEWKPVKKRNRILSSHNKLSRPSVFESRLTEIQYYPWHAQVVANKKFDVTAVCGGVVVSKRIIITAAHCVVEKDGTVVNPKQAYVLVGSSDLLKGNKYKACKISEHPGYQEVPFSYYFDVALILLQQQIKFDRNVQPAKIIQNDHWRDTKYSFDVVGFGATSLDGDEQRGSPKANIKLHKTRMRYVDSWKCNNSPSSLGKGKMPVPPHMFCMIGVSKSDCFGDSGSGVVWGGYVVGLVAVSRGEKCGTTNIPSMYNDLNSFEDWIRVESNQLKSVRSCKR